MYLDNIIEKINDKFTNKTVPVTIIIENLKKNDKYNLGFLLKLINDLKIIKAIFIEKTSETTS